MKESRRLLFVREKTDQNLTELWNNCFEGPAKIGHINAYSPYPVTSPGILNAYLRAENGCSTWLIKRKSENDIIGYVLEGNLFSKDEIGFVLGLPYIRKGYATETLHSLLNYRYELGKTSSIGHCFEDNIASVETMLRCGFTNKGRTGSQHNGHHVLSFEYDHATTSSNNWLNLLTVEDIKNKPIPVLELLENSLYYPSSGFDGGVIRDSNLNMSHLGINSFVYCDYAVGKSAFLDEMNSFHGYSVIAHRDVQLNELTPNGWKQDLPPGLTKDIYLRFKDSFQPFAYWAVYERNSDRDSHFGPKRISLLYLGGEGVATYQALYWSNKKSPTSICIIQPGDGFGLNYTKFSHPEGPFHWVVYNHPQNFKPKYIYYGGYTSGYHNLSWIGYEEIRTIYNYYSGGEGSRGEVTVWG